MKKITAQLDAFYGYGCGGGSYGSNKTVEIEVSDEVAAILSDMMEALDLDEDGPDGLTNEAIEGAITEAGFTELQPLHDELFARCSYMEALYWCLEADIYDCLDESLEPAFYKDVKDGLYKPETDEDYDPDNGYAKDSYEACCNNYLAWVRSHTDDPYFMAERLGIDLSAADEDIELSYVITEIE